MHRLKRQSTQRTILLFLWRRKVPLIALLVALASYSKSERALALASRTPARQTPQQAEKRPDEPPPPTYTVRSVGSSSLLLTELGVFRVGDDLAGWTVSAIDAGAATLHRDGSLAVLRPRSVFEPTTGRVSR